MPGRLDDIRYALRRRTRRLRYALEDIAYGARRAARSWSGGARRQWAALTLRSRQRLAGAGVALLGLVLFVLLVVPNLPCQLPGGRECQPGDDAIAFVPADALAYAHLVTDPDTEQFERAEGIAERLPAVTEQLVLRLPRPEGARIEYRDEVAPWLGDQAALALLPGDRGDERVAMLEIGDEAGAREFAARLVGPEPEVEQHREVEVQLGARGLAVALVEGFLLAGPEPQVMRAIDTEIDGGSLGESEVVKEIRDGFPRLRLAELVVTEDGAEGLFGPGEALGTLEAFVNARATRGVGVALAADEDGLRLSARSVLDPERLEDVPGFFAAFPRFEPALEGEVSEGALAYLALGAPGQSLAALIAQATSEAPGLAAGFEQVARRLRRAGDVSLERDVLGLLTSQAAVSVEPRARGEEEGEGEREAESEQEEPEAPLAPPEAGAPPGSPEAGTPPGVPFISLIADDVDEERATRALAALQGPIADALGPGRTGQAPGFEARRIDGAEAHSLRVSPTVRLTYAVLDDKLVISTDPLGVGQVQADEPGLDNSDRFEAATRGFEDDVSLLLYLNLDGLLSLAEVAGLSADPAYATFGPELRRLEALGLAVDRDDERIDTEARVPVGGD